MRKIKVTEPAILIRIAKLYTPGMSHEALYEATRGVWKAAGERRDCAKYAFAIADGVVREVYHIQQWHPAGSTEYRTRSRQDVEVKGRWEFTGQLAPDSIRSTYVGQSVAHYFCRGNSNPILYVNV